MGSSKPTNKESGNHGNSPRGGTRTRGSASVDPAPQREIAEPGGQAAPGQRTAGELTSEEARRAGSMSHGNRQSAEARSASGSSNARSASSSKGNRQSAKGGGNKQ